ncbi:DMT family transporter [Aestuariivivens sediminis]|uniref:DMT family transporter n=1 Tax=Aestuariivivens sediminis TaxID=2913557 RepID=UPI001F563221|nr:DMT family transporter [Aestuariivivens sediminis]
MQNSHLNYIFLLLLATLFISTSGALGKFIDMPVPVIIWWRSILASLLLYGFCRYKKYRLVLRSRKDLILFILSGLFLATHWITYFYALKLSNVAIGMLSLFVYPILTALIEPLFIDTKFDPVYILLGIMVLFGIYILAPEFNLESAHVRGALFGLLSALFFSIRNIISKQMVSRYNSTAIMFYQITIISVVLLPVLWLQDTSNIKTQYPYIIILGVITTAVGHTMLVNSLRHFTVSTASIISSIQPILGIVIAFIFLNEIPSWNTYIGGFIILLTVVIESIRSNKKNKELSK